MKKISFISGLFCGFLGFIWTALTFLFGLIVGYLINSDIPKRPTYFRPYYRSGYSYDPAYRNWARYERNNSDDDEEDDDDDE